jgi:hypothetical protein
MDTLAVATIHDHWAEDTVSDHGLVALKLWARHLAKQHPIIADGIEWTGCGAIAIAVLCGSLIGNA